MNGDLVSKTSLEPGATTQGLFTSHLATEAALSVTEGHGPTWGPADAWPWWNNIATPSEPARASGAGAWGVWMSLSEGEARRVILFTA